MKWTIENGIIRFSESVSGSFEVVVRDDMNPNVVPDYEDLLFGGNTELIRLYTPMVRAHVRMKLAERAWKSASGAAKQEAREVLVLSAQQFDEARSKASSMRSNRESGIIRLEPIRGRGNRLRRTDWR